MRDGDVVKFRDGAPAAGGTCAHPLEPDAALETLLGRPAASPIRTSPGCSSPTLRDAPAPRATASLSRAPATRHAGATGELSRWIKLAGAAVVTASLLTACTSGGADPPASGSTPAAPSADSPVQTPGQDSETPDLARVVGKQGGAYRGSRQPPTGDKAESKLWFQDGRWWALMVNANTRITQIYRLDGDKQAWEDTGVFVDDRLDARGDALWDGQKLYVATSTAYLSEWQQPPTDDAVQGGSALLLRFSYLPIEKSYRLDPGFPTLIRAGSSESINLGKDSTGQLWVTYTRLGKVFVNRTTGADESWGEPFVLPSPAATVDADDTSALVAFGGRQVGVLWSNQRERAFYFAMHDDTAADDAWRTEVAYGQHVGGCARGCANDHISLRALPDGRLFAAIKTANRLPNQPFIVLLDRDRRGWASHVAGTVNETHTRPLVVLDDEKRLLHLFTVVPEVGGAVYYKTTNVDRIAFEPGLGVPFISGGGAINNPTSTKQAVDSKTGLVVLAADSSTGHYWYNTLPPR